MIEGVLANAPTIDMTKIEAAFDKAIGALKAPKLRIDGLLLYPAKASSSNAGALYVKESGTYLGKIAGGKFVRSRDCSDSQEARLIQVAQDPAKAVTMHGLKTGICACCGAELTNAESVARGVGPVCAARWGF